MIIIASYSNVSVTYTADGTQTVFSFPFDYLRKAFVYVEVNEETILTQGTDYSVSEKTVVFPTAPASGTLLRIYRETDTTRLVSWADASVLKASDMTVQQVQELHILEEQEYWTKENTIVRNGHEWNARHFPIKNTGDPVDPKDATTKEYVDDELDTAIENLQLLADVVVDSEELQHITDQFNAIDENAEIAANAAETAVDSATSANASKNSASASATSATNTANALITFLETKETLTAPAVDSTLTITGAAADAKATGDKITELDGAVFERGTKTIVDSLVRNAASSGTTNLILGTTIATTQTVDIELTLSTTTASSQSVYWRNADGNLNKIGDIPANADHVVFTEKTPTAIADRLRVNNSITSGTYTITITEKHVIDNIAKNTTAISRLGKYSPITEFGRFELGSWSSVSTFNTSNTNRVGCATPIVFDKTVQLSALNGYCMSGYRGTQIFTSAGTAMVPAGTELRLFIRKMWEDAAVADVDEFTSGIYVLNYEPLTEYERLFDTFAGLEMFRTAGFIGDSYTATRLGYSWVDIVQGMTGVQCKKFAKSGLNTRGWINDTTGNGLNALLNYPQQDLYWIALGINDGDTVDETPEYLGSIADISGGDYTLYPNTFYGNYGRVIETIQDYAPNAKFVLYKPIFKSVLRTLSGQSATQNGIKEVRDAIAEIAEHYSLPCMDALDDVFYQTSWYAGNMDSLGTHPTVMLYPGIAKANLRLFSKCVRTYETYFKGVWYNT